MFFAFLDICLSLCLGRHQAVGDGRLVGLILSLSNYLLNSPFIFYNGEIMGCVISNIYDMRASAPPHDIQRHQLRARNHRCRDVGAVIQKQTSRFFISSRLRVYGWRRRTPRLRYADCEYRAYGITDSATQQLRNEGNLFVQRTSQISLYLGIRRNDFGKLLAGEVIINDSDGEKHMAPDDGKPIGADGEMLMDSDGEMPMGSDGEMPMAQMGGLMDSDGGGRMGSDLEKPSSEKWSRVKKISPSPNSRRRKAKGGMP